MPVLTISVNPVMMGCSQLAMATLKEIRKRRGADYTNREVALANCKQRTIEDAQSLAGVWRFLDIVVIWSMFLATSVAGMQEATAAKPATMRAMKRILKDEGCVGA